MYSDKVINLKIKKTTSSNEAGKVPFARNLKELKCKETMGCDWVGFCCKTYFPLFVLEGLDWKGRTLTFYPNISCTVKAIFTFRCCSIVSTNTSLTEVDNNNQRRENNTTKALSYPIIIQFNSVNGIKFHY